MSRKSNECHGYLSLFFVICSFSGILSTDFGSFVPASAIEIVHVTISWTDHLKSETVKEGTRNVSLTDSVS